MAIRSIGSGQKVALLINECQRGIVEPGLSIIPGLPDEVEQRGTIPKIARLLDHFRGQQLPIFHLPFIFRPGLADVVVNSMLLAISAKTPRMLPGYPEAEFAPGLEPVDGEYVVTRTANLIAFNQTELDSILRRLGIETVVLTGVSTNVAIAGNTMAATDLGYNVVIPEDCIAGGDPHSHRMIVDHQLRLLATITDSASVIAATS